MFEDPGRSIMDEITDGKAGPVNLRLDCHLGYYLEMVKQK
jgi:hypothetical protein